MSSCFTLTAGRTLKAMNTCRTLKPTYEIASSCESPSVREINFDTIISYIIQPNRQNLFKMSGFANPPELLVTGVSFQFACELRCSGRLGPFVIVFFRFLKLEILRASKFISDRSIHFFPNSHQCSSTWHQQHLP